MSIVPVFGIGMWNAWILMVIFYGAAFVPLSMKNGKAEKRMEGEPTGSDQKKATKIVNAITHDEPIDKGIYAISRHPGYLGFFLAYAGTGIACASWIFLLFALVWIIAWHFGVAEEERILLEKYGEPYQQYMNRTPRWIGLPQKK